MSTKKTFVYKNDLKFNESFDIENSEWESEVVKDIYNDYKKKPKIELRIKDSEMENYDYLDLSRLSLNDELLNDLFNLAKIKNILKRIKYLDLSNNDLTTMPNLLDYPNIIYLSISYNNIKGIVNNNNIKELSCEFNKITNIISNSITKLAASNNLIKNINIPNIQVLVISDNLLNSIDEYSDLNYLECINNKIKLINNLGSLKELYIANNGLEKLGGVSNLSVLNCAKNPINKIGYFKNIRMIVCSTPLVSSKYKIINISKVKDDFFIEIDRT